MKQILRSIIIIITFNLSLFSQSSIDSVLLEIERNNTTLTALQKRIEADKIGNKTNIYYQNPEVELRYLWGNPSEMGNRTDFSISQSFDFPTAYKYKKQIADIKNEQTEFEYQKQRKSLHLESQMLCYDLIYYNALASELSNRIEHAKSIASSYNTLFDAGETNILDYNKAQLNSLILTKELEFIDIERKGLLGELLRLNAGIPIEFTESEFQPIIVRSDFEQWYQQAEQKNPILNWLKKEIEINEQQVRLEKAMNLPKLQAGYTSEAVIDQKFKGITVGVSIPLWENKNKLNYAKANTVAMEDLAIDKKVQLYNQLKVLHTKAIELQNSSRDYNSKLQSFNNSELLKKALDMGEITLIDYILELSIYYESVNKLLILERDMNKAIAELSYYN